jgi:DNA-binding beta-propeller fold protein YncE
MKRIIVGVLLIAACTSQPFASFPSLTPPAATPIGPTPQSSPWWVCAFGQPTGIAVDDSGNVFVADFLRHLVVKLDPAGREVLRFGGFGPGEGELASPAGLTIAGGELYVADHDNDRIQVFSLNGEFVRAIGSSGVEPGQFSHPAGVAVSSDGLLFVAEDASRRVQQLTAAGDPITHWTETQAGPFVDPVGLSMGPLEQVWLADYRAGWLAALESGTWRVIADRPEMEGPNSVAFLEETAVVADFDKGTVGLVQVNGTLSREFTEGADGQLFQAPWSAAVRDQTLYVTDVRRGCVHALALDGRHAPPFESRSLTFHPVLDKIRRLTEPV